MDVQTQTRLLGVLQTSSFSRLGGKEDVEVDLRIIATTQRKLDEEVPLAGSGMTCLPPECGPLAHTCLKEHADDVHDLLNFTSTILWSTTS
jgi:hypothetical protein